ncbi:DNA mismatch repair protein msh6 [Pichia californica]|nr:DNA mismatch repair protein msh6 [[Candida] californica]
MVAEAKKMKQASLMSFFGKKPQTLVTAKPKQGFEDNNIPITTTKSHPVDSITPDNSSNDIPIQSSYTSRKSENKKIEKKHKVPETPKSLKRTSTKDFDLEDEESKENSTFKLSKCKPSMKEESKEMEVDIENPHTEKEDNDNDEDEDEDEDEKIKVNPKNNIPSSPVTTSVSRRSRKVNYSEISDEEDDDEEEELKPKKKRKVIAWDDADDEDFEMNEVKKNVNFSDDDFSDDDLEKLSQNKTSIKEELIELNDKTTADDSDNEDIVKDIKPIKQAPKRTNLAYVLSSRSKQVSPNSILSSSLTPQKKFNKENEERYQWLINMKDADGHLESDPDYDPRTLFIPQSAWLKFTAFEKQYWSIKSKMWDTIVFFKKGKFFELYEKDADVAHSKFDLKLAGTGRANMRLAGIPEMSFDLWTKRFIDAGYKVAKVDQKESLLAKEIREKNGTSKDSKESKVIQRELSYVLTCGTLIDENLLDDEMSKYCFAIKESVDYENNSKTFGICFVDVSTGNFQILQFVDDFECSKLETLLSQINPMEVLLPKNELDSLTLRIIKFNSNPNASFNFIKPEEEFWDHEKTVDELSKFNTSHELKTPEILKKYYENEKFLAFSSFGAIFWYLRSLKLDENIVSMGNFTEYDPFSKKLLNSSMRLDGVTLQNLEIFNNSFDQSDRGTLFKILNKGLTPFGKRTFKSWVIHPLLNKSAIDQRLDSVELLLNDGDLKYLIESKLKKVVDVERMLTRIHSKILKAKDFVKVIESFEIISELMNGLNNYGVDNLKGLLNTLVTNFPILELDDLLENWNDKFDKDLAINEDLIVPKKGVDEEFDESNSKIIALEEKLESILKDYKSEFKCNEICYKDSGKEIYLIEIPIKINNKIPRNWQQMASTAKCKRYWSPEVKTVVKELMELKELHKIICLNLKDRIYENFDKSYDKCMKIVSSVGKIDCLVSLTRASEALGYPSCRPEIVENKYSFLDFKQLRHPCFMPGSGILNSKDFIPNDISLGLNNENSMGLLTGANAAGKSTLLRMTCIATIMAQIGCFLPADSAKLTPIDSIMTRLGANDNIMQGKSTFYVELLETKKMLDTATPRSLIILDELGRGGSSSDGFAIAEAVLHHFATHVQSIGFFATHYANLGQSFINHPKIIPLRMSILVDAKSKKITFLYKLEKGQSNGSFGMHVATMCGIPSEIVENAEIAAKKWEHTSKLNKSNLSSLSNIPLGLESDFSWLSQRKIINTPSFGEFIEKESLRSIFNDGSTIDSLDHSEESQIATQEEYLENEHDSSSDNDSNSKLSISPIKILRESQKKRKYESSQKLDNLGLLSFQIVNLKNNSQIQSNTKLTTSKNETIKRRKIEDEPLNKDTWVNESRPMTIDDLSIHKRKIEDLKKNIDDLIYNKVNDRILIVSGPSGSGKSTAVKLIANMFMKEKIRKLKDNMIGSEISDFIGSNNSPFNDIVDEYIVEFNILKDSQKSNSSVIYFNEFLDQCKMLTGLNEKCIIIEELPNIFHKETHYEFQKAIKNWIDSSSEINLPPLIICITEFDIENDLDWNNGTSFTIDNVVKVETVLGFKLMQYENSGWTRIKFNKVAKTFLKKALNRVLSLESIKKNKVIDKKVEGLSGLGDLRNAINTLEFWYKFQYDESKFDKDYEKESISGKETGLDIFHTIGKIIHGTKHEDIEFEDFQKRHNFKINTGQVKSDIITVDNVSNEVMSHLTRFNLCCLENYNVINPPVCNELNELMNVLSLSDDIMKRSSISNSYNSSVLQNVSFYDCLGLRYYCEILKKKKNINASLENGRKKIMFSRDSKLRKKIQDINREILEFKNRRTNIMIQMKNYSHLNSVECVLIDGYYKSNLMSSFKFRYKQHIRGVGSSNFRVERIGGKFMNSITADDEFHADEDVGSENDEEGVKNRGVVTEEMTKQLERDYFGVSKNVIENDVNFGENGEGDFSDGEFESDPLEWSDEDNGDNSVRDIKVAIDDDNDDVFSDDSAVLENFF